MNDIEIFKRYVTLYPSLCFKKKINGKPNFIYGIVSNNGPICFYADNKFYDELDIMEMKNNHVFSNYTIGSLDLLDIQDFKGVSYFDIENGTLYNYFGNVKNVLIPSSVNMICASFKNNPFIKKIESYSAEYIRDDVFSDIPNLEELVLKNAVQIGRIKNAKKLKKIDITERVSGIKLDQVNENFILVVNGNSYSFNSNLDSYFLESIGAKRVSDERINVVKNSFDGNLFLFADTNDSCDEMISNICVFESVIRKLPQYILDFLKDKKIDIFTIRDFPYAGCYNIDTNNIVMDRMGLRNSLYHEIGHAIDHNYGLISNSEEFRGIYYEEKNQIYTNYVPKLLFRGYEFVEHIKENEEEYFAECFQRIMEDDEFFKVECPKTYDFFINLLIKLKNNDLGDKLKR